MASVMTNYLGNFLLGKMIGDGATYYIALFTTASDPSALGLFTSEVAGGSYARQPTAFSAPSGKTVGNTLVLSFTNMPAVTVRYVGVCKTLTGTTNDLLVYMQLASDIVVADGKTLVMEINDVVVTY